MHCTIWQKFDLVDFDGADNELTSDCYVILGLCTMVDVTAHEVVIKPCFITRT